MKFLFPSGGLTDHRFGILTSPQHKGVPVGIKAGMPWAADLGCLSGPEFVKRFDKLKAISWLETMNAYYDTCLFVTVPDHVGNAAATLGDFDRFQTVLRLWPTHWWPLAFVAQDGQESLSFPATQHDALFVGGNTDWKMSDDCISVVQRAQEQHKHIHIGRVNNWRRYKHFAGLKGSKEFTCDGTKQRFIGLENTVALWANYQERDCQARFPLPDSHCSGKSSGK